MAAKARKKGTATKQPSAAPDQASWGTDYDFPVDPVKRGAIDKMPTGIPGFDYVGHGGLPLNRATLIAGTAGSAKTIFVTHFLAAGVMDGEGAVFVTFEDSPEDIRKNMLSFGWDIAEWEQAGKWAFVDVSPEPSEQTPVVGAFDLGGLISRVEHAVKKTGARRVALDSLSALFVQFPDRRLIRSELYQMVTALKRLGATVVFTAERTEDYGLITPSGVEEFVADNVIILRNLLVDERRRRTLEILKYRGANHERGEVPFTIMEHGIIVIPLTAQRLIQESSTKRVTSGIKAVDEMCGGGFFRDSIVLVSGATGTGKTLFTTQFLNGFKTEERALLFAFEESRDQLYRNAAAWGMEFEKAEKRGLLKVVNQYPHAMPMEDHLVRMRDIVAEFKPNRVAVDSLSALERVFTLRSFREFVISLTATLKKERITGLFTSTTPQLLGGGSVTEKHISTLTDSIVLLRYVEVDGRMRRSINVLKMRGSPHDTSLREYTIDSKGMHVGKPFHGVTGILTGSPRLIEEDD